MKHQANQNPVTSPSDTEEVTLVPILAPFRAGGIAQVWTFNSKGEQK